jgi:regulator of PEP synthase PpsR (kinase-PPPase family)
LRSNPVNCLTRINKRNRKGEDKIDIGYINSLHELHELAYENAFNNRMNIIAIDVENKSISEIANEIYNSLVFKKEFINK